MIAAVLFILSIAVYCSSWDQDYRLSIANLTDDLKNCTIPGPLCDSCSSLVYCVEITPGEWQKIDTTQCTLPEQCVVDQCTTNYDPICNGTASLTFPCQNVGIFPDPFFCNKYVMCVPESSDSLRAYSVTCDYGYGYNIATGVCDIELVNNLCDPRNYPVPLCKTDGQNEALTENPSIYYICERYDDGQQAIYPKLYICSHGWIYQGFQCQDPDVTATPEVTQTGYISV